MEKSTSPLIQKETLISKIFYPSAIFVVLLIRAFINGTFKIDLAEVLYLTDTYLGFRSKTFIGTVIGLFTEKTSPEICTAIFTVTFVINLILISILLGSSIKKCKNNWLAIIIIAVLVGSQLTEGYYAYSYLLDIYWMTVALISIFSFKNKYTRWLIPLITFIGFWIHYAYCIGYMLMIVAIIVYETFKNKPKKTDIAWFVFCALGMAGGLFYFLVIGENIELHSQADAMNYLSNKFTQPIVDNSYFEFNFYKSYQGTRLESNGVFGIIKWMLYAGYKLYDTTIYRYFIIQMIALLVVLAGFFAVAVKLFKAKKEKNLRFICFAIFCSIIGNIIATAISTDTTRWFAYALICQGGILLYMIADKDNPFKAELDSIGIFVKDKLAYIVAMVLICCAVMKYVE